MKDEDARVDCSFNVWYWCQFRMLSWWSKTAPTTRNWWSRAAKSADVLRALKQQEVKGRCTIQEVFFGFDGNTKFRYMYPICRSWLGAILIKGISIYSPRYTRNGCPQERERVEFTLWCEWSWIFIIDVVNQFPLDHVWLTSNAGIKQF